LDINLRRKTTENTEYHTEFTEEEGERGRDEIEKKNLPLREKLCETPW